MFLFWPYGTSSFIFNHWILLKVLQAFRSSHILSFPFLSSSHFLLLPLLLLLFLLLLLPLLSLLFLVLLLKPYRIKSLIMCLNSWNILKMTIVLIFLFPFPLLDLYFLHVLHHMILLSCYECTNSSGYIILYNQVYQIYEQDTLNRCTLHANCALARNTTACKLCIG